MSEMRDTQDDAELAVGRPVFRRAFVASLVLTLIAAAVAAWVWLRLPSGARVPMHWNAAGHVDGYGSPASLLLLPGMMLFLTLLFAVLPSIEPRRAHLLRSSRAYCAVWLGVVILMGVLHGAIVLNVLGVAVPVGRVAMAGTGILFTVLGNYLGKVRSNFFFGVRTPWTLSSELAWNKTHRLAGRWFLILGIAIVVAALVGASDLALLYGLFASLVAAGIATIAYSYFVWRSDPQRQPRA